MFAAGTILEEALSMWLRRNATSKLVPGTFGWYVLIFLK